MTQKRKVERQPSYLGGKITFNQNLWSEDCIVRNASRTGAKLTVKDPSKLPDHFNLSIPSKGKTYRARIKWREADQIGVEFELGEPAPVIELASARHLRRKEKSTSSDWLH